MNTLFCIIYILGAVGIFILTHCLMTIMESLSDNRVKKIHLASIMFWSIIWPIYAIILLVIELIVLVDLIKRKLK